MVEILKILLVFFQLLEYIFWAHFILLWLRVFRIVIYIGPIESIIQPFYRGIRKIFGNTVIFNLDFAPMILVFSLQIVQQIIINFLK